MSAYISQHRVTPEALLTFDISSFASSVPCNSCSPVILLSRMSVSLLVRSTSFYFSFLWSDFSSAMDLLNLFTFCLSCSTA